MKLITLITLLFSFNSYSQVWNNTSSWNNSHSKKFSQWASTARNDLVINKSSPYYGLGVDCADLIYLLAIVYSFENKLEYKIIHPKNKTYITNKSEMFNHYPENERLNLFIDYVFKITSTISIRDHHSYPIKIENIKPGDLFHYEKDKNGVPVRHVVLIQKVLNNGNFSYIYSTQATKSNNLKHFKDIDYKARPFSIKTNKQFSVPPSETSGGFRRIIPPHKVGTPIKSLSGFSREQFSLSPNFFSKVKKILTKNPDSLKVQARDNAVNICKELKDRSSVINEGHSFFKTKGECLSFREFDTFSTPMRDSGIKKDIHSFIGLAKKTNFKLPKSFCSINIENKDYKFKDLIKNFIKNKTSGDPHQPVLVRWGLMKKEDSFCKKFY